jgi:hypothetical protein
MASVGVAHSSSSLGFQNGTSSSSDADRLPNELGNMSLRDDKVISSPPNVSSIIAFWQVLSLYLVLVFVLETMQDVEDIVVNGNGAEPGHIIVTSIDGRNGQAKQVF